MGEVITVKCWSVWNLLECEARLKRWFAHDETQGD